MLGSSSPDGRGSSSPNCTIALHYIYIVHFMENSYICGNMSIWFRIALYMCVYNVYVGSHLGIKDLSVSAFVWRGDVKGIFVLRYDIFTTVHLDRGIEEHCIQIRSRFECECQCIRVKFR
ncbi:uncharacterized protein LOC117186709 [Drosophila miranda]|uniref:uncharacterized protein LOC117186709 n=1 Tax=Drosophila miranda TaxID=7229 RepID=UPI00143F31EB|nr:uncharacterized protein LOC117186709 [Drosophila miranda]